MLATLYGYWYGVASGLLLGIAVTVAFFEWMLRPRRPR